MAQVTLAERYAEACATESDIYEHLPRFVDLCRHENAQHVVELGTRTGVSTIGWLYGLEQTGGHLTSVDLDERPDIGDWPHWTFIQGDDLSAGVVSQVMKDTPDIVFIDTSHHYRQTHMELALYGQIVKAGGLLVLHDTGLQRPLEAPEGDPDWPVRQAITEYCAENRLKWVDFPECWGLGVIRTRPQ